jgi:DNA repair exonuclease SbcCD ATPase subunit
MILAGKIRYKNIFMTGNQWTEIVLNKTKTTLIIGKNASGKSTLLDAITYVLYGKPFRNINIPQLINTRNNAELLIEFFFSIGKTEYMVRRGLKPKVFEVFENGKLMKQSAATSDYQEILEKHILKMNYKTFTQIVIIGNASYKPFMKLTPAERRMIVEDLLDINVFSSMNALLKLQINQLKKDLTDVSYHIDLTKEKLSMYSDVLSESDENIQEQLEKNNRLIYNSEMDLQNKQSDINSIEEEITILSSDTTRLNSLKKKFDKLSEFGMTFKGKIKNISKEIEFFDTNQQCPTCSQEIVEDMKLMTLEKKKGSLSKYQTALTELEDEYQKLKEEMDFLINNINRVNELQHQISILNNDIENIQNHIKTLLSYNNSLSIDHNKKLVEKRLEYSKIEAECQVLVKKREEYLKKQHVQSVANILLKDDGIKTKIIRHYLPQMNIIINKYLSYLGLNVQFNLDENFNEVIKTKSKESLSYYSFSEGEKLRIDTAIMFTWREISKMKNSANINLLMLDEIFDSSLDTDGIDEFLNILSNTGNDLNTFIISHRGEVLLDKFDRVLKVDNKTGFSKVQEVR